MTLRKKAILGLMGLLLFAIFSISGSLFENVDARKICVIQAPVSGELTIHFDQGLKYQGFGKVTTYDKEKEYSFSGAKDQGSLGDQSIGIRFNDGGKARISGTFRYELPGTENEMRNIHFKYGSMEAVDQELVRTVIEKAVYMTGPLMSSKQSSAEKRNDLLSFIEDQAKVGVYKTRVIERKEIDPLSGKEKTVAITELIVGENGLVKRQDESPLSKFGINLYNLSLNNISYDETIENQITEQQAAIMRVQTSIAEAREAEQMAIKAEAQGKAEAATARANMEVEKVTAVTKAEQKRDVARLALEEAEFYKKQQILKGEGEAARKRLAAQANGSLEQKLAAYIEVQKNWANAFANSKQAFVPSVIMGGSGSAGNNSTADNWMQMMMVKSAKDLSLDMKVKKQD